MSRITNNSTPKVKITTNQLHKMMHDLILGKLNNITLISNRVLSKKFSGYADGNNGSGKRKFLQNLSSDKAWVFGTSFQIDRISGDEIVINYRKSVHGKDTFQAIIKLSDLEGSDRDIAKRARKFYYMVTHDEMIASLTKNIGEIRAAKREIRFLEKSIEKLEWEINNYKYELDIINPLYDHYMNGAPLVKNKGSEYENHKNNIR